jgi:Hemagglutinin repeat
VQAWHDLQVTGSSILSNDATKLLAGNDIAIAAATNTVSKLHHSSTEKSGFMSGGGIEFSYGTKTNTVDQERDATLQSGDARSRGQFELVRFSWTSSGDNVPRRILMKKKQLPLEAGDW